VRACPDDHELLRTCPARYRFENRINPAVSPKIWRL